MSTGLRTSTQLPLNCRPPGAANRRRSTPAGVVLVVSLYCSALLLAEEGDVPRSLAATMPSAAVGREESDCRRCHTCEEPTPEFRCLPHCTRSMPKAALQDGPDVVIIRELEDRYLPVPFDHRGHASMAEMGDGCATCHHHTPRGERPPACGSCHSPSASGTDIHKPGLRGAYHQQCLNCHRQWMDERDCAACHTPRKRAGQIAAADPMQPVDDNLGQRHPPIPLPDSELYEGGDGSGADTKVIFRHQEHIDRFGLKCVECHHAPSCTRCHAADGKSARPRTVKEHHRPCLTCHKHDMDHVAREEGRCNRCHWRPDQPMPKRFDHAEVGWPLKSYHQRVACRRCHPEVPFVSPSRSCQGCHDPWAKDSFDHRVTGQALDGLHQEADCEMCHPEGRHDSPPVCAGCHDPDDDGIAFPARRPGPLLNETSPARVRKSTS